VPAIVRASSRPAAAVSLLLLIGAVSLWVLRPLTGRADDTVTDPYLGQPAAIDAGEQIYREHCIICHGRAGGRGPDLFAVTLTDEEFLDTVLHGRPGTVMPAFSTTLSRDDIWKVRAFVKATPKGL